MSGPGLDLPGNDFCIKDGRLHCARCSGSCQFITNVRNTISKHLASHIHLKKLGNTPEAVKPTQMVRSRCASHEEIEAWDKLIFRKSLPGVHKVITKHFGDIKTCVPPGWRP